MHFDSLSLLKVESTVCFQRERYASFAAKNLESPLCLMHSERGVFPRLFIETPNMGTNAG
ncbi:hypothetical protein CGSMWGv1400E_05095 [Gardnerella vaginalis 1400E]|uniref:Uncharacterized protein n=1 Tax=Gardnerella vaginalis 1400E TaxID=698956 RepID=I4LUA1_GARVA|nr:hypothetical protein CGSMWGv1400E_05095 [Gardnerella vaginalis 1400E]